MKSQLGYCYCKECGAVSLHTYSALIALRCKECGKHPSGNETDYDYRVQTRVEIIGGKAKVVQATPEKSAQKLEESSDFRKRVRRRDKKPVFTEDEQGHKVGIAAILFSMALLLGVFSLALFFVFKLKENASGNQGSFNSDFEKRLQDRQAELELQKIVPYLTQDFNQFLFASSSSEKIPFIYQGDAIALDVRRYYQRNVTFSINRGLAKIVAADYLDEESKNSIGVIVEAANGETAEVFFVKKEDAWLIDWYAYEKFDEIPWSLFTAENDGAISDFRLYMRILSDDVEEEEESEFVRFVFSKVKAFRRPTDKLNESKIVRVEKESDLGKKILSLKDQEPKNGFFADFIPMVDPEKVIRVRARLKLHKKKGEPRRIELIEILADNWSGIEQADTKALEREREREEIRKRLEKLREREAKDKEPNEQEDEE